MDVRGKKGLVLGGFGLVGMAVCRKLATEGVKELVVTSLKEAEAREACDILAADHPGTTFTPSWGDLFVRTDFKNQSRRELLSNPEKRRIFIRDLLDPLVPDVYRRITLYDTIVEHQPYFVVDCINTATGIAYQDVYEQSEKVLDSLDRHRDKPVDDELSTVVEDLIASLNAPQLVRHIQILHNALIDGGCRGYLKVGTTGTGGMGLNIPYTHSEDRPSRVLLTKNAMGGAQSLMMFLMARTPLQQDDGTVREIFVKEIKPAAAIAWKGVRAGEIRKKGQPFNRYDHAVDKALPLTDTVNSDLSDGPWEKRGDDTLKSVYIDTGENGIFSEGEFTAITEMGQMEFVTPEEIAQQVAWELMGGNSGHDVIGALDASVLEPTYRAGVLRQVALDKLRMVKNRWEEDGAGLDESVAFELLGPPRLTKLLHEANLIRHAYKTMRAASQASPDDIAEGCRQVLATNPKLRSAILSVGVPILLPDGKSYLRGPKLLIPHHAVQTEFEVTDDALEGWCEKGWVDLRPQHMEDWLGWFDAIVRQKDERGDDTSSRFDFDEDYFDPDDEINPGKMVGWIFINVDKGKRVKR